MAVSRHRASRLRAPHHLRAHYFHALESRILFSWGLTTTTNSYTVDTGAGLVFSIARTTAGSAAVGDLTSTILNGTQLEAPYSATSRYSHYESGLSSATVVTATVDPNGNWIMIACNDTGSTGVGVIQYYVARKGYNNIYMATDAPGPTSPSPGEMRFIMYTNHSVLTNAPAPSNNTGSTGNIESSDVFGFANGTTSSKYYGEYRAIDTQTYGLTGGGFGVFMNIGNRENSSGGPFFKDIDYQTTSAQSTELYNYMFSGHSQTENFRPGLQGFYALEFTTSATTPAAPDYTWIDTSGLAADIAGYVPASGRGTLTGIASGVSSSYQVTVGLSNAAAQFWATPDSSGNYTIPGVLPGTYTETLYQGEMAVGATTVTITAGQTTAANIADSFYTPTAANTLFSIGSWDGTPLGFLNANNITTMHPTDVRMSPWATDSTGLTNFIVGTTPVSSFPMAEWHTETGTTVNGVTTYEDTDNRITFTVTSAQAATALTLRIGITRSSEGRPTINVNNGAWSSATPAIATEPDSRGLTTGNWRGNNAIYTFDIPAGTLVAGTDTIDIFCTSGSTGTIYSGYQIYDAIDLIPTAAAYPPAIASVTVTPSSSSVNANGSETFTAVARDASGNVIPANFTWSASRGTIDNNGNYTAPASSGSDTITVIATTTSTPGFRTSTKTTSTFTGIVTGTGNSSISITGFGISPAASILLPGGTLQLVAGTVDSSGNVTTPVSNATWSILSGPGSVTSTGLFIASTTPGASTTVEVTAPGNLTATSTITIASPTAEYTADTPNGTTLTDSSGNNLNGTLTGSYSYTPGISGDALTLSGGYAALPAGIVSTLSNFTISTWVNLSSLANWARIFDFGTGTTDYMFLTADAGTTNALRFSITTSGNTAEQQLNGPALKTNTWYNIAVTLAGTTATLYLNGTAVATNANMTLSPSSLGNTTLNYLGKSQFSTDPALNAALDDFRIYPVALSAQQILELATPTLITPASTPTSPITTTTANLTVVATDVSAGEPALTYTWSTTGTPPPAAPVTFTNNGTNAGKNTTATFTAAGTYNLLVTITNPAGLSTTSTTSITVTQTATSLNFTPTPAALYAGASEQLTVTATDQFGATFIPQNITYTLTSGAGTLTPAGLYTAPLTATTANFQVTASNLSALASITTIAALLGDANLDGKVDANDLNIILSHLGVVTTAWTSGNFDGAPTIDLTDLNDVLNNLGTSATIPTALTAPPSPTTPPSDDNTSTPTTPPSSPITSSTTSSSYIPPSTTSSSTTTTSSSTTVIPPITVSPPTVTASAPVTPPITITSTPTAQPPAITDENIGPPLLGTHLTSTTTALHPSISIQPHKIPQIFWRIGNRLVRAYPLRKNRI